MANFEKQKAEKLTVEDVTRKQLDGEFLIEFNEFLDFLKKEKISLPWKSINGFKMKYKGKNVGSITLGAWGWLDNVIETKNYVVISVETAEGENFDKYLEGQTNKIIDLFMEQISNKCIHCRPTCGCSHVSGRAVQVSGERNENVCMNAPVYKFIKSGKDFQDMTMCSPCALYPPIEVHPVPLETVRELILARKVYVEKTLTSGK